MWSIPGVARPIWIANLAAPSPMVQPVVGVGWLVGRPQQRDRDEKNTPYSHGHSHFAGSLTLGANYQLTRDRANGSGHGVYETFMVDGFFGHLNEDNHRCARCRYFHGFGLRCDKVEGH
jgi:hypothetical protein